MPCSRKLAVSGERFSSSDFSSVADELSVEIPEKLLHADVLGAGPGWSSFSGLRRHFVRVVDLPSRLLSVTIGGLKPGESSRRHRHNYETIIYVLEGRGTSEIGPRTVQWKAGDALYIPTWAWHAHTNGSATEPAMYLACENAPMLQNLGIALRQES